MNHRKQKHPSNRMCKYYLKNECVHGLDCWYRHDEPMDIDNGYHRKPTEFKCLVCGQTFDNFNGLKAHKRKKHPVCERFV